MSPKIKFQTPTGMKDLLPEDLEFYQRVFEVVDDFAQLFGFNKIQTPIVEDVQLFENAFEEVTYLSGFNKNDLLNIVDRNNNTVNYLDLFKIGLSMISKGLINIGAHGTLGFGYVSLKEKCSLSISSNIKEFVKMFLRNRYDEIHTRFKNELYIDKTGELNIDKKYYPEIIKLLIHLYERELRNG